MESVDELSLYMDNLNLDEDKDLQTALRLSCEEIKPIKETVPSCAIRQSYRDKNGNQKIIDTLDNEWYVHNYDGVQRLYLDRIACGLAHTMDGGEFKLRDVQGTIMITIGIQEYPMEFVDKPSAFQYGGDIHTNLCYYRSIISSGKKIEIQGETEQEKVLCLKNSLNVYANWWESAYKSAEVDNDDVSLRFVNRFNMNVCIYDAPTGITHTFYKHADKKKLAYENTCFLYRDGHHYKAMVLPS
jgi:hypothetical protein